uniref:Uncharacterized protein n=1 Tax=Brassica oleracea var. oleracea TaxID=109376 RepID=A0A0D3BJX6_BRAOL
MGDKEHDTTSSSATAKTRTEVRRRTISPYDLTAGDNPGTIISKPALRGPNYDECQSDQPERPAQVTRVLTGRDTKKRVGSDLLKRPPEATMLEDSEDYEDRCANNALVISWIKLTIDESLCFSLSHCDDAYSLWTQIQRRFAMKNGQRVQRLKTELANCRQQGVPIETYYGKLTKLWTSLADYQQAKTLEEIEKQREEDKLHQFLMGIGESLYGAVKSSLLSRTPLPTLDEAYNILTQDEES